MANDALVTALFGAYATFTAFGAAVAGFVAAGGAVQTLTSWWIQHGEDEDGQASPSPGWLEKTLMVLENHASLRWLAGIVKILEKPRSPRWLARIVKIRQWSAKTAVIVVTLLILAVIVISGVGLVLCFLWLAAYSHGSAAGIPGIYTSIILLFWIEASLLTVATVVAVIAAAGSALTSSGSASKSAAKARAAADSSADLDAALRDAALVCLEGASRVGST